MPFDQSGDINSGKLRYDGRCGCGKFKNFSQLLHKHYGQRVILLIDEYDVPLDRVFQAGYYDEMVSLIRNVLGNVLETNDSLYFAVLTGSLRISKESVTKPSVRS